MKQSAKKGQATEHEPPSSYRAVLEEYLATTSETSLRHGYELGRQALSEGVSLLEMAGRHHSALAAILSTTRNSDEMEQKIARAAEFFAESISPYEMARRGYHDSLAALRRLNETLEEEVRRIAHDVHDESGQLLVAVYLELAEVARGLPPELRARLDKARNLLDRVEAQLRELSHELHPTVLDDLGLVPAVEFLCGSVAKRTGLTVRVEADAPNRLPPAVEIALYRVVQEALTNAAKHARARSVRVLFTCKDSILTCAIEDDGVGFDVADILRLKGEKGLGLIGIQERLSAVGGTIRIDSAPGKGTRLCARVPLRSEHASKSVARR